MTTYTDEVNIYNPDAISGAIDDAGNAYKTYITEVTSDGIMVAAAGKGTSNGSIVSTTTGWHLSDVLEWVRNGISRFWIGLKNDGDTTPTVRIGKAYVSGASDNESHMELDFHSQKLIDKEGNEYLHVSDLRDSSGNVELVDTFIGTGTTTKFRVSFNPVSNPTPSATVDGNAVAVSNVNLVTREVTLASAPADGSTIVITYKTKSPMAKAFTFGTRDANGKIGGYSFASGYNNIASGHYSYAEGHTVTASGAESHAEGRSTTASGNYSHAECDDTLASGWSSHAEGSSTTASELSSHAEGMSTTASGVSSHAEGAYTTAAGISSHAEGYDARAAGFYSHAQNEGTYTGRYAQTAIGTYNVKDWDDPNAVEPAPPTTHPSGTDSYGQYAFIIGNGTSDNARSNALTAEWSGSAQLWHHDIERGTAPSSSIYGGGGTLQLVDKDGHQIGYLQPMQLSDGTEGIQLGVSNSDSTDWNTVQLAFDSNDNPTVSVSDADKWRNALGITDSGWQTLTLNSATNAYDSDSAPKYRKCFNVVNVIGAVKPKSQVAAGGTLTIGTLPSGYRPVMDTAILCQGSGQNKWMFRITSAGVMTAERYSSGGTTAAMGTSAWLVFNATFICA